MPDFDANDDSLRLSASGMDDSIDLPKLTPRFAPRLRQLAERRCFASAVGRERRVGPRLQARARHAARNACATQTASLTVASLRRRRLWTKCHGQRPGSVS